MEVKVEIKTCAECNHIDHSGAFTKGGAQPVCSHPMATNMATKDMDHLSDNEKFHWRHRVLPFETVENPDYGLRNQMTGEIPKWCPLQNGGKY